MSDIMMAQVHAIDTSAGSGGLVYVTSSNVSMARVDAARISAAGDGGLVYGEASSVVMANVFVADTSVGQGVPGH